MHEAILPKQIEILCCATLRVTDIMKLNVIKIRFM